MVEKKNKNQSIVECSNTACTTRGGAKAAEEESLEVLEKSEGKVSTKIKSPVKKADGKKAKSTSAKAAKKTTRATAKKTVSSKPASTKNKKTKTRAKSTPETVK